MPYRHAVGDYTRGYRGDPGIFGTIFGGFKKLAGAALGFLPGGGIAKAALGAIAPRTQVMRPMPPQMYSSRPGVGASKVMQARISPGGTMGPSACPAGHHFSKTTGSCVPNRRMNVGNARALRRAIRRQSGFVKLARRALAGSGYRIVSKGSGRRRVSIKESGPGSVTVQ